MNFEEKGGRVLDRISLVMLNFVIPVYILLKTDFSRGVFSLTTLPTGQTSHMITILTLWLSSWIFFFRMKYLYPLARIVAVMIIAVFHIHNYDFMWGLQNTIIRGQPLYLISFIFLCVAYLLLGRMSNIHGILKNPATHKLVLLGGLVFVGFLGMYLTDFWDDMERVDQGECCIDPNQNIFWVMSKIPSFFLLIPFIDDRDVDAPLKLSPNVFTW